jgi:hypothetical protein
MGGVPGQKQPSPAELPGHAVLHPDPRGPGKVGDLRAHVRFSQQRLKLSGRDRRRERGQQRGAAPPGRVASSRHVALTKAEHKHQAMPPGHDMGAIAARSPVSSASASTIPA